MGKWRGRIGQEVVGIEEEGERERKERLIWKNGTNEGGWVGGKATMMMMIGGGGGRERRLLPRGTGVHLGNASG